MQPNSAAQRTIAYCRKEHDTKGDHAIYELGYKDGLDVGVKQKNDVLKLIGELLDFEKTPVEVLSLSFSAKLVVERTGCRTIAQLIAYIENNDIHKVIPSRAIESNEIIQALYLLGVKTTSYK